MISIVTISMNQGRFLPAAVDSVLSQRDVDLEYVIVDAGSTDGSRDYLQTLHDPRVRFVLEPDQGPADGLNKGLRVSSGTVMGYLNADDLYLGDALRGVDDFFRTHPLVDLVYANGWVIDGEDRVLRHYESTPWGLRRYLNGGVSVLQQSTFFRREAFERTRGFNPGNATCWDGELLVDVAMSGSRLRHFRADWSAFRLHPGGISGSGRLEEQYHRDLRRLWTRATGREPETRDTLMWPVFRAIKLLRSPGYASRRIRPTRSHGGRIQLGPAGYSVRLDAR